MLPPPITPMSTSSKTTEETSKAHRPDVPPEILQNIFRSLTMHDLLRCQRVNTTWRAYLPGNDPTLCRKLFTPSRKALVAKPKATPRLTLRATVEVCIATEANKLPHLVYMLSFMNHLTRTNMPTRVKLHPIIEDFGDNMELVNDEFRYPNHWSDIQRARVEPWLMFTSLADLRYSMRKRGHADGNWKDHLMCVPAIEQVVIQLNWLKQRAQNDDGKRSMRTAKMDTGVTVGEFVRTVRKMLADHAVEDVKRIAHTLEAFSCGACGDGEESDMYWVREEEVNSDEGEDTETESEENEGIKDESDDDTDDENDEDDSDETDEA
jgi:hypothetical protein